MQGSCAQQKYYVYSLSSVLKDPGMWNIIHLMTSVGPFTYQQKHFEKASIFFLLTFTFLEIVSQTRGSLLIPIFFVSIAHTPLLRALHALAQEQHNDETSAGLSWNHSREEDFSISIFRRLCQW